MKVMILFVFFFLVNAFAEEAKIPCIKKDGTIGFNNLEQYDCGLINKVVESPEIQAAHKAKLDEKLAEKLAFKLERNIEEIAMLDQYFNQFEFELTKTQEVKRECKLEVITNPDCGTNEGVNKDRLKKLNGKLRAEGDTLFNKMFNTFSKSRGLTNTSKNQCPLVKPAGYYTLNAQFNQTFMKNFTSYVKKKDSVGFKLIIDEAFENYPQLKLISLADKSGNPGFKKEFEEYMKAYDEKDNIPIKAYVLGFYAKTANQNKLATGLASACSDIQKNIKKFLCEKTPHLAMPEETANYFFANTDDAEDSVSISNAFSCLKSKDKKYLEAPNSVHDLYFNFKHNVVKELPAIGKVVRNTVNDFCSLYTCQTSQVKGSPSCINGGPISVEDIKKTFNCDQTGNTSCSEDVVRAIAYLESLDLKTKDAENIEYAKILGLNVKEPSKTSRNDKTYAHSDFMNNLLGVEGSLKAEGKSITPITVAEKVREFEDKKIDVIPAANKDVILANNEGNKVYNLIKNQKQEEALTQQNKINQSAINTFVNYRDDREEEKRAVIAQSISKFSKDVVRVSEKDELQSIKERERNDLIRRMRAELETVTKSAGASNEDQLATVAANNDSLTSGKKSTGDTIKNVSTEERERLESYRKNLQNWETRIREREYDLNERDFRPAARSASSEDFKPTEKRFETNREGMDQTNSASASGTSASNAQQLRLSKAGAVSGGAAANEVNNEQDISEAVDGEAIVSVEALATLEKGNLKKLGIAARDSFIIKVRHLEKLYDVPVKSFTYKGKSIFVPLPSVHNRDLAKVIMDSPLFFDYRQYQQDRHRALN